MPYQATVLQVMIASPGDVSQEREIVKKVIREWNDINASDRKVVLIPVGWDTHIAPEMNIRPQERINKILLKDCDILVGILWTRVGTPTGKAVSGTVEEIEEHIKTGKPTMLYFSSKVIPPDEMNNDQYSAVKDIKHKYQKGGITKEFSSSKKFEELFRNGLSLRINEYLRNKREETIIHNSQFDEAFPKEEEIAKLSEEAKELLLTATTQEEGELMKTTAMNVGTVIQAGEKRFGGGFGREAAKWESALNELIDNELVAESGTKGEVFRITHKGWQYADELRALIMTEKDND